MTKKKYIIDRSKWQCGGGGTDTINNEVYFHGCGTTHLLNRAGYMCCLGHISLQCGVPQDVLLENGEPCNLLEELDDVVEKISFLLNDDFSDNSILTENAMHINDDGLITHAKREQELKDLFAASNIELEFIGEFNSNE